MVPRMVCFTEMCRWYPEWFAYIFAVLDSSSTNMATRTVDALGCRGHAAPAKDSMSLTHQ